MTAQELFRAGKASEAIQKLVGEVRDNPADSARRTFLFELLCFKGEHDRAAKHLDVLARDSNSAELGALLYKSALAAEKSRLELFRSRSYPASAAPAPRAGSVNEKHFQSLSDADPRIGPRLEVYAAGQYLWIPFEHITYIEIPAPRQLRDLLWAPALVRTGPAFRDKELGEVLIPVISPMSFEHPDDAVKLGRATEWQSADGVDVPLGQKMLLADDEEIPFLEIRTITFDEIGEVQ
jgi:type VI secretion system protein ImpE